ncbi:ParB/RepB/Spo0J family partition protein [Candidatus Bathyarchaeota archaeon]|nr:ParB/RepB/Spo0J family partition protein [Candidatus Bathyarchaeota archaeon]
MSENYDLRKSVEALGKLSPVLKDAHGNVIDGLHRLELYPDWPCVTVGFIDTTEKLEAARLAVNTNRRLVSSSEIAMRVELLLKSGLTVEQISGLTGLSERTIYRYKPLELKKPEAKAISKGMQEVSEVGRKQLTPVSSSIKTQDAEPIQDFDFKQGNTVKVPDIAHAVKCERCTVETTMPKPWHGHTLCSKCFERAEGNPVAYDGYFKMLERGKTTIKFEPKIPAPSIES